MKEMWKGNFAIGEGALRAGMRLYAGYPITPATEIMEYLSYRMPELGRVFVQAESELAAINTVFGSYAAGMRSMTGSSGPGISLKQEGISYLVNNNIPCVFVNVQRWGTGLGSLFTATTDYRRDTGGGGEGDYRIIVFAPNSIQEAVDLLYDSFDLAEKYRIPVEIFTEAALGQMMAPCEMPPFKEREGELPWVVNGSGESSAKFRPSSAATDPDGFLQQFTDKYEAITEKEQRWESFEVEDAEYVCVAIGMAARVAYDGVRRLRSQGEKVGLIRPITIWPFPIDAFKEVNPNVKGFISVEETDHGQMIDDIALSVKKEYKENIPVFGLFTGFRIPKTAQVIDTYQAVRDGEQRRIY
ncbi:MAG: 3-methyl-2-oxobutanoate dehydrogenase subunit beta [Anaerolineales bacterium]|nr:3-methyl-2-oxobutanoate dehydrogenase subunit beta [Anaerolineales bacterium]